jgi:hypothetical protein
MGIFKLGSAIGSGALAIDSKTSSKQETEHSLGFLFLVEVEEVEPSSKNQYHYFL